MTNISLRPRAIRGLTVALKEYQLRLNEALDVLRSGSFPPHTKMEITIFTEVRAGNGEIPERVGHIFRGGGIAALPTDTVYGLVCDAGNEDAIRRMFAMKKRPEEKAFPIFVKDVAAARYYAYISDTKARFLEKVWPGPVTVVFQHKDKLPPILTGDLSSLGIRMPDHLFLQGLFSRLDFPLAQTSANISDKPAAKTAAEVLAYFEKEKERPDLMVDGGLLPGTSSTVIDFTGEEPIILRAGQLKKSDLDLLLGRVG
jgi:L-threonylcarbamoyladenylate synthase